MLKPTIFNTVRMSLKLRRREFMLGRPSIPVTVNPTVIIQHMFLLKPTSVSPGGRVDFG